MNFIWLFKSSKDFQLDKSTFVNLRWIALLGQFATISIVKLIFQYDFYFLLCNFIVGIGVLTNVLLQFKIKQNQLNNNLSTIYLTYDIIQLGILIYLTGGITNPFIFLVVNELKDELKGNKKLEKDIDLLISQSDRCNKILKKLSMNPHVEDEFISSEATFLDYLSEIIRSFQEISEKKFLLDTEKNKNLISFRRSVEINYGLRNFIGNANKFSKQKIEINLLSDKKNTEIQICDDGPGFPNDIIDKLGEPYIKSSSKEVKPKIGLGLGTFIGKTLLEKNYGKINFKNSPETKGALVNISWLNVDLKRI